jgi:hypothetical protein
MIKFFKDFIFESYGSNELVRQLTSFIYNIIDDNLGKLILNKKLIISDSLKDFKNIHITNDSLILKLSNRTHGNVNISKLIINEDNIENLIITLEIDLSDSERISKRLINNKIVNTINHEFQHIIEQYLTLNNNKKLSKSWEYDVNLKKLDDKYKDYKEWQDVSYLIYLSLPHEMRARISSIYEYINLHQIKDIDNIINYIKNNKYYKDADFISQISIQKIIEKLKSNNNYDNLIIDFNNIFLQNNIKEINKCETEFIKYFNKIKKKNNILKQKLLRTSYNFIKYEHIERDENINYKNF